MIKKDDVFSNTGLGLLGIGLKPSNLAKRRKHYCSLQPVSEVSNLGLLLRWLLSNK